ncbi:lipopolysaccharide biosynthesis protein [Kitasatospora sp. NPDC048365]|uniref:lipopolysaccharide biosynthesis protein n=1 Tax=Kitasatospora sp. NPDC048365 TaxID=3364050 RepID=UPI003722CC79
MAKHSGQRGSRRSTPGGRSARHARPTDQVYRSSFFLLASTVITAALGFLFWVVVARYYTIEQVGLATSLVSASVLLANLSLFGLNNTLIRFPAPAFARNGQITQSIVVVAGTACLAAVVYLLGLPLYGSKLVFFRDEPLGAAAFVVFCALAAVNLLTKSVFVGARVPQYNVVIDGLLQGVVKLVMPTVLVVFGTAGIVGATGAGYAVAVVGALFAMRRRLGFRFDVRTRRTRLREQLRYSFASHVSGLLGMVPMMVLPLTVLHRLGAAAAGCFFVAFQIAALLNAVSSAVGEAMFAEASSDLSRLGELLRRSARIIAVVQIPAVAAVVLGSGLLLHVFGGDYRNRAQGLLVVLALGALAVALRTWANSALKVTQRMRHLVLSNVLGAVLTIGLAQLWAPRGLVWVGWAWGIGNLISGLYAAGALLGRRPAVPQQPRPTAPSAMIPAEGYPH